MYGNTKSDSAHKRSIMILVVLFLATLPGCGGSSSLSRGVPQTEEHPPQGPLQWKNDPLTTGGTSLKSGADYSKSLEATATALGNVPTENSTQQAAMANAVVVVRQMGQRYGQLKPNLNLTAIMVWLAAQAQDRARLKAAADALRRAGLAALADAMNELSARKDVLMFRRSVPYGGVRHAYLTSPGPGNVTYLEGYRFGGIPFQVFDKSLTSRGQVIDQPLYQCQMEATEGKPKISGVTDAYWTEQKKVAMYFLDPNSDCGGQTQLNTLGYVAKTTGVVTARPLHWLRRWEHPDGNEFLEFLETLKPWNLLHPTDSDSNFYDSVTLPGLAAAQAIVYSDRKYNSVNDLSESTENNFHPIGFVP